jgi:hypothetical protein
MMIDHDGPPLSRELDRAIAELRRAPEMRPEWLASVVGEAARQRFDDAHHDAPRRWSFRPSMAIAAGLLCAAVGAGATYAVTARRQLERSYTDARPELVSITARPRVRFVLVAPGAGSVSLVGDFNSWNPVALPLRRRGDGTTWEVEVPLAPGRYTYAFIVDGRLARDPSAPETAHDDFGGPSSVVLVSGT